MRDGITSRLSREITLGNANDVANVPVFLLLSISCFLECRLVSRRKRTITCKLCEIQLNPTYMVDPRSPLIREEKFTCTS